MSRKLHNTVSALMASSALLVLGLIAAAPLPPQAVAAAPLAAVAPLAADGARIATGAARIEARAEVLEVQVDNSVDAAEAIAHIAAFTAETATAAALAGAFDAAAVDAAEAPAPTPRKRAPARRSRQSVAMPYFSFAPRG